MTQLPVERKQQVGECWVCVIFFPWLVTCGTVTRAATAPPAGSGAVPREKKFGPYFPMGRPAHGFVHGFTHGFGAWWFPPWNFVDLIKGTMVMLWSRVNGLGFMYASTCIYIYIYICCNTERNIMKNQDGRPDLGSRGKYLCIFVLCFMLSLLFIFCF